ncbi:MAG: hypothetical protein FWG36_09235 [Oscillospiraceae bacterium]|nr:hypothetical protein [Oscillospiraceae bacterium]
MPEQRTKTSELLQKLFRTKSIAQFIRKNEKNMNTVPFHAYINRLCAEKDVLPAYIIKKSGIERTFGHQIFNGKRNPSRDKIILLAFGFEMDYDEAQALLKSARKSALYPKIERDAVVIHALKHKLPIIDVQSTLSELSLPLIGEEGHRG